MKNKGLSSLAKKGRNGDDHVAHLQTGEMVVPAPVISDELKAQLYQEMIDAGIDPNEYTVGGEMSINPETGLPEFGIGKSIGKAFKSVKKIVSSPIISAALPFALGPAGLGLSTLGAAGVGAGLGALSGNGLKGIAAGALGAASTGIGNSLGSSISSLSGLGNVASRGLGSALVGGASGALGGGNIKDSILSGGIAGLGSLYNSGGFNNLGGAFKESGLSGALSQFGENLGGAGDILGGGATAQAGGGGSSSYTKPQDAWNEVVPKETITWDGGGSTVLNNPTGNVLSGATDMAKGNGRGLSSLLSAGIDTYSNNKAADQMLKYQKEGLAALTPYLSRQFTPGDLTQDPGYQFQLAQGTKALDSASAARGNYYSGDALRSAGEYATGLADQTYNAAFQRDQQQNNANVQGILAKYGILGDMGNTKARATLGNANSWTDSIANYLDPQDDYNSLLARLLRPRNIRLDGNYSDPVWSET